MIMIEIIPSPWSHVWMEFNNLIFNFCIPLMNICCLEMKMTEVIDFKLRKIEYQNLFAILDWGY